MKTRVKILRAGNSWVVRFLGGPRAERIQLLFGTDTLPLPYGAEMSTDEVAREFMRNTQHAEYIATVTEEEIVAVLR